MKKEQEDTLNMYQSTFDILVANAATYAANLPFTTAVGNLDTAIEAIGDLRDQQEEDTKGVTEDKQNNRQTLEEETYTIASVIIFYASGINNRTLLQKVNFTRSELSRARDNELPGMSEQVHQAAVANAAAILPFGVTATMITDLNTSLQTYVDSISKPRAAISDNSAATEQLPQLFADTTKLLEESLDKGMELYRVSASAFYAAYFNARIIVNSPTHKRALEVVFIDSLTEKIITHVKVRVGSINRRSSKLGRIFIQNLTEGAHTLKAFLPGYKNAEQDFNIISGETTKLTVIMDRG